MPRAAQLAALSFTVVVAAGAACWSDRAFGQAINAASAEDVGPAAAVVAENPYQTRMSLTCSGNGCTGQTPVQATNKRLIARYVSCSLTAPANAEYDFGDFNVLNAGNTKVFFQQFLVPAYRNGSTWFINQETEVMVGPNRKSSIRLATKNGTGNPSQGVCSLSGQLQTLN